MLAYHPLKVVERRAECADAISIAFETPPELREAYRFLPGQHIGVRAHIGGQEVRRTYSICSGANEPLLRIGVRLHEHGAMSQHLARNVRIGDTIDVLTPTGRFLLEPDPAASRLYCAFAAGSGVTPILGILRNALEHEPKSRFLMFYGNRTAASTMFSEDLLALKDRYPERIALYFLMSREPQEIELFNGRLDRDKVARLGRELFDAREVDAFFVCGPDTMIDSVRDALLELGVEDARIHSERFATTQRERIDRAAKAVETHGVTQVTVVMDGRRRSFTMQGGDLTVLEAAEQAGLDLPYSCRAGVCSTCRARIVRGAASMRTNYALEPWEVEQGFVLCCQALPTTPELELDYDAR